MIIREIISTLGYKKRTLSNQVHLRSSLEWLHNNFDKGYLTRYSPLRKKDKPSPGSSGDVLSSIIAYHQAYKTREFYSDIVTCTNWLLQVQNEEGSYFDSGKKKQVFGTARIILGLTDAYYFFHQRKDIRNSITKAANWLVKTQREDGTWFEFYHDNVRRKCYSTISWALLKAWQLTKNPEYKEAGIKNLNWIITQQSSNCYLQYNTSISKGEERCLCAITSVLEGCLESYKILKNGKYLEPVLATIKQIYGISQTRDFIPLSKYDGNWRSTEKYKCITGLIQLAGIYVNLYEINRNQEYLKESIKLLEYIKSKQCLDNTSPNLYGAFPAGYPVWSDCGRLNFLSYNNKLFIELILRLEKYQKGMDDLETYIAKMFDFYSDNKYVSAKIDKKDKRILDISKEYLGKKVLDIGCGKGKYVKYLRNMQLDAYGIDPSIEYVKKANTKFVNQGSIYNLRFKRAEFDSVLLIEVLQHVKNLEKAFKEIKKVLRKNGHCVIVERNKMSVSQILKPIREQLNLWMYPKDSPFKEISLYKREWIKEFSKYGRIKLIKRISGDGIKAKYIDKYYLFVVEIKK